ncbi:MAG TPA: hypothetical protein VFQ88_10980 [Nevskiaceae bacterium]|nr:hypothetical protein [Nevskiaceae bacterium]
MRRDTRTAVVALLVPVAGLALAACSSHGYCLKPQAYDSARSIPPLQGAGALKIPQAAGALVVPPMPADPVPFGTTRKQANGSEQVVCLDQPPPMPKAVSGDIITTAPTE